MGKLILVGTPIGNMGDLSPRAVQALADCHLIAAEDTRRTGLLLHKIGIKKPMVSYHAHNRAATEQTLLSSLDEGNTIALVTDAGMPGISDPGQEMVALASQNGHEIEAIPGPTAFVHALVLSGLSTQSFLFEGFLPTAAKERKASLMRLATQPQTLIFYEAPHRLFKTLTDCHDILGNRPAALARELTKLHEEVLRLPLSDLMRHVEEKGTKGEYVLVIAGAPPKDKKTCALPDVAKRMQEIISQGQSRKQAAKIVSVEYGIPVKQAYEISL